LDRTLTAVVTPYTKDLTAGPRVYLAEAGLTATRSPCGPPSDSPDAPRWGAGQRL